MKEIIKNRNGITLIALVVTVLIIIILAGVSLSIILGENGILTKAKVGKEQHKIEDIRERLDLVKGSDFIKEQGNNSIDTYFKTLEEEKVTPYKITDKEKLTNSVGSIEVDNKYLYLVTIDNNKNVKIEYEGKTEEIDRKPDEVEIVIAGEKLQNSLPVNLNASAISNGNIKQQVKYVINKESEKIGIEENLYTNEVLNGNMDIVIEETGNDYYIHTLTLDKYGRKQETVEGPIIVTAKTHSHTGSNVTGGGCYTKSINHTHSASCNKTCSVSEGYGYRSTGEDVGTCGCGSNHRRIRYIGYRNHSSCGIGQETLKTSDSACSPYYVEPATTHQYIACGKTTSTIEYLLNCGKTETTLEGYTVNY